MDDPLRPVRQGLLAARDSSCDMSESGEVELRSENREAAAVYMLTRNQVITAGMGQVVDISIPAIKIAMDLHGVADQKACLAKVIRVFHHFEKKRREQSA